MTLQYFKELAAYNLWANAKVCGWLAQISDEQWHQEIVSSFNSIQETVLHVISAENIWLQRFKKETPTIWLQQEFTGTKEDHIRLWKKTSADMKTFIDTFNETDLNTNLDFKRINGNAYSMPFYQLMAHVVNHATYHRGQLVTMLRQTGFTNVDSTDLTEFYTKNKG
jgi:uncharacterized damage-inducible protein DinB